MLCWGARINATFKMQGLAIFCTAARTIWMRQPANKSVFISRFNFNHWRPDIIILYTRQWKKYDSIGNGIVVSLRGATYIYCWKHMLSGKQGCSGCHFKRTVSRDFDLFCFKYSIWAPHEQQQLCGHTIFKQHQISFCFVTFIIIFQK